MSVWQEQDIATRYTGGQRAILPAAHRLIDLSGVVNAPAPRIIFDTACGTGIVTLLLHDGAGLKEGDGVVVGDISEGMIKSFAPQVEANGWTETEVKIIDAQDTKLPTGHFTHVRVNFGIMLMPRPDDALKEILRILRPGGALAFSCPIEPGWATFINEAVSRLQGCPSIGHFRENWRKTGQWHDEAFVRQRVSELGFVDIKTDVFAAMSEHGSLLGMLSLAVSMTAGASGWTEDQVKQWMPHVLAETGKVLIERYGEGGVIFSPFTTLTTVARKSL